MFIIVIGIIALLIGLTAKKSDSPVQGYSSTIVTIGTIVIIIGALIASVKTD